jgi:hypothetical protein
MFVPIGEFLPDMPDFNNPGSSKVHNVFPRTQQSYGPVAGIAPYASPLPAAVIGAIPTIDTTSAITLIAGTQTDLYQLVPGSTAFVNRSKVAGGYGTPNDGDWHFAQFGQRVVGANFYDPLQSFTLNSSTAFADLASSAPKARYIATVKDFLVVANTTDPVYGAQPQRVWWSAINDCTNWPTPGTAAAIEVQSDYQDIPGDQGWIQGIVGNLGTADGAIFFDHAIWRMTYVGSPSIFSFQPAEGVRGTPAPRSITQLGAYVYYLGEDGFYRFDGTVSQPIGVNRVDKYFYGRLNQQYLRNVVGAVDPINRLVMWAYPGPSSTTGTLTDILIYNWALDRWSDADFNGEYLLRTLTEGYSLDSLDSTGFNLDNLPFSLDSRVWAGNQIIMSAFDSNHTFGYMNGPNLAVTIETSEFEPYGSSEPATAGQRAFVRAARPMVDGGTPSVAFGYRNRLVDPVKYSAPVAIDSIGSTPQRVDGRYLRGQITMPAASSFTHIQGVDVITTPSGER